LETDKLMSDKYPLCRKAGLGVRIWNAPHVLADDVERLLESAPVVYGLRNRDRWDFSEINTDSIDTHSARLLLIEPIVRDTAESLLRELIRTAESGDLEEQCARIGHVVTRARRLLERK
jgi:hypothetical protein